MAVQVRLSAPSRGELEESIRVLGPAFSPTSPVREGRLGDWICYGVFIRPGETQAKAMEGRRDGNAKMD